ncbi:MAG: GNAT family N-acetyltransferase [Planctomycetia bacterium]|nr:GNAT family N-acetyltransferase [Planctomycetia bacterium]
MIKRFDGNQTNSLMNIWLETNRTAHHFVASNYWISHYNDVQNALKQAEIYYFEENNLIKGFVGIISPNYIAGLFVLQAFQSQGIGKSLLAECKRHYFSLSLNVFIKNRRAVSFYLKQGFEIESEIINQELQEKEYLMIWSASSIEAQSGLLDFKRHSSKTEAIIRSKD